MSRSVNPMDFNLFVCPDLPVLWSICLFIQICQSYQSVCLSRYACPMEYLLVCLDLSILWISICFLSRYACPMEYLLVCPDLSILWISICLSVQICLSYGVFACLSRSVNPMDINPCIKSGDTCDVCSNMFAIFLSICLIFDLMKQLHLLSY
jgi:hypothetical protein